MANVMVNYEDLAQKVWAANDVLEKKELLNQMIDSFRFKKKFNENVNRFRREVEREFSGRKLDRLAANLALNDTMKVI